MGLFIVSVLLKKSQLNPERGLGDVTIISSKEMPIGQVIESKISFVSRVFSSHDRANKKS